MIFWSILFHSLIIELIWIQTKSQRSNNSDFPNKLSLIKVYLFETWIESQEFHPDQKQALTINEWKKINKRIN